MRSDILKLMDLQEIVINKSEEPKADIRLIAKDIGLDIDKVMKDVIKICKKKNYNVGYHMFCTRLNVIPEYVRSGKLELDIDHIKGLRRILIVDKGMMSDY